MREPEPVADPPIAMAVAVVGMTELLLAAREAAPARAALGALLVVAARRRTWRTPALSARVLAAGLETLVSPPRLARTGGSLALIGLLRETSRADRWDAV
jgi:hypothetical protein